MVHAIETGAERLAHDLLDPNSGDPMADELVEWLTGSAPFRSFAKANRDKIRKKLRSATDAEARRDVRAELQVARMLLADRRMELTFEAYGSRRRGPDFTVAFRGERPFNLEVTRRRRTTSASSLGPLLAKLRQMPPSVPNALVVAIEGDNANASDVDAATRALRDRADAKDEAFFVSRGFESSRHFYQRYLRLGAVLVWCDGADGDARATLWTNRSARIAVPERAARACLAALRGR